MIRNARTAAEALFSRPSPVSGSDAAKLIHLREAVARRKQEARESDLQDRLEKRVQQRRLTIPLFRTPA